MIKDYHIIQVLDDSYCSENIESLTFGIVKSLEQDYNFDDEYDEENDCDLYRDAIQFTNGSKNFFGSGFKNLYMRLDFDHYYNLISFKVEYYKNGNIKKPIIESSREIRPLSSGKVRKKIKKRTGRMVRGS